MSTPDTLETAFENCHSQVDIDLYIIYENAMLNEFKLF